jgi:ArsR family transcriptional regulator
MADLADYAAVFKALADPQRLRLLSLLPADRDKHTFCVCELADKLGMSQPCLSHHLNVLKNAGVVRFEKEGCSVFYYLDEGSVLARLDEFKAGLRAR